MSGQNEIDKDLAHKIHAAQTAAYYPYQEGDLARRTANTIRNMGYDVNVKPHGHVYEIDVHQDDLGRLKTWYKSLPNEVRSAALDLFDNAGKYIPKQAGAVAGLAVSLIAVTSDASANTGDPLTKTEQFLNTATKDIGGKAVRAMVAGDYDVAQRDIAGILIPGADSILRSKEAQAVIAALPKNSETLTQMQKDMKLPPIDRHLAEYQLHVINASKNGELINGLNASSTLTNLAEKKVRLEAQWKLDADTFRTAAENPNTNWVQFKKEHTDLAIQADLHVAAKNSGYAQAFVNQMDKLIADNTAKGTPMQPIAQQLSQLTQQQHSANGPNMEQVTSR